MTLTQHRIAATMIALLAGVLAWMAASRLVESPPPSPSSSSPATSATSPPQAPRPSSVASPKTGISPSSNPIGLSTGIGEVPLLLQKHFNFAQYQERVNEDLERVRTVGATWYRHNTINYPYFDEASLKRNGGDLAVQDKYIHDLQAAGLDILLVIGRTQGNAHCENDPGVYHTPTYYPATPQEEEDYRRYVHTIVERYDGDGSDDAPGLVRPILWYELDNEVDLHYGTCHGLGREWQSPQDYYKLLKLTRPVLKEAHPHARLLPGIAGMQANRMTFTPTQYAETLFSLDGGGAGKLVDGLVLHDYNRDLPALLNRIDWIRKLAGRDLPVWLTELGLPSAEDARPGWTPSRQANEMVQWTLALLGSGKVERIFWFALEDTPRRPSNPMWRAFGTCGMFTCEGAPDPVDDGPPGGRRGPRGGGQMARGGEETSNPQGGGGPGGRRPGDRPGMGPPGGGGDNRSLLGCPERNLKPAGATFARLNEVLRDASRVEALPGGLGYRIQRQGQPDAVIAWDTAGESAVDLMKLVGQEHAMGVTLSDDPKAILNPLEPLQGRITLGTRPTFLFLER